MTVTAPHPADVATPAFTGPSEPAAVILADSISPEGVRLISFQTDMHRFVGMENNTQRVVSKCAGSNRAVPLSKTVANVRANPAYPVRWTSEQPGMQGGDSLDTEQRTLAHYRWRQFMEKAIQTALELREIGVHKSLANRLLEPFQYIRLVQTGTAWDNFLDMRDHPDAQPEFAAVARLMRQARDASTPVLLQPGQFHLPYVTEADREQVVFRADKALTGDVVAACAHEVGVERTLARISAARCARTSYLTNPVVDEHGQVVEEGRMDLDKDFATLGKLLNARPRHWSPFEHQGTPWAENRQSEPVPFEINGVQYSAPTTHLPRTGNLLGWRTQRTEIETSLSVVTFR